MAVVLTLDEPPEQVHDDGLTLLLRGGPQLDPVEVLAEQGDDLEERVIRRHTLPGVALDEVHPASLAPPEERVQDGGAGWSCCSRGRLGTAYAISSTGGEEERGCLQLVFPPSYQGAPGRCASTDPSRSERSERLLCLEAMLGEAFIS